MSALGIDRRAPRVVLPILGRERIDQAFDAVVADFSGESVAIGGREARTADLDVVYLPSRRRLLHLVIHGNRVSPRLPDFEPDRDLHVAGLGAQGLELEFKPLRAQAGDMQVTVRFEVRQSGAHAVSMDYEMEKTPSGWKVYDVKISGASLAATYRDTFAGEIRNHGIEGLIDSLSTKNRQNDARRAPINT